MTRDEFVENVTCWSELLDFCYDEDCNYCEDVYDDDAKDDYFNEDLVEMARNVDSWQDMKAQLDNIPDGYDYYIRDEYGEWSGADDYDFERYKDDVLEWGDDHDIWDEDEEEEGYYEDMEPDEDDDTDELEPDESMSIGELFVGCASTVQVIVHEEECKKAQEEQALNELLSLAGLV